MRTPARPRIQATLRLLAVPAAVAILTGASLPAQAQFFTSSGANGSFPTNFFPLTVPIPQTLDFTGNTVSIGNGGVGSFSAAASAVLKADALAIGDGGNGTGNVSVSGAGTSFLLGGIAVGNWGNGTLTISAGALVDAAARAADCATISCFSAVGNGAGSTGTVTVTGAGSELRTLRSFNVSQAAVFTQAVDGFDFGTPGGTTNAFVNVLDGGTVRTQNVNVGVGPSNAAATGTEQAFGTVTIDGAGSKWIATRNTIDAGGIAFFGVGNRVGGHGAVTVSNGGQLVVDGTGGSASSFDVLALGSNGGTGSMAVTGLGSTLQVQGTNPFIAVGRSGGHGSLTISAGATASALLMGVGRENAASTGLLTIDGAGSRLNLIGIGLTGLNATPGAAGLLVGQTGGTGEAVVSDGGTLFISDGGGNTTNTFGPFLHVGREAGSNGALTITGAGSTVQMTSTSLAPAPGSPDNFNPYMTVGTFSGATGSLVVDNGGKLLMQGNALSTPSFSRGTTLVIGGNNDTDAGGTGTALVSGPGSEIRLSGSDTFIAVGRGPGSVGALTVANQGSVSATTMNIGRAGGSGSLSVDNGSISLSGQRTDDPAFGAALSIGNRGGAGTVSLTNGSVVNITNMGAGGVSLNVGGTPVNPLGNGSLDVSSSQINLVAAPGLATARIGHDGTGTATFGSSSLNIGDGSLVIAGQPGSTGTLTLNAGSVVNAGYVGVGATKSAVVGVQNAAGAGHLVINDSTVNTTTFEIGAQGVLSGDRGIINASGDVIVGGTIDPGNSPGRIRINCNLISLAGSNLVLDIAFNGTSYDFDEVIIGSNSTFDLHDLHIVFNFLGDADPNAFAQAGLLDLDTFLRAGNPQDETDFNDQNNLGLSTLFTGDEKWSDVIDPALITAMSERFDITELQFNPDNGSFLVVANAVPEPPAWALMLVGLLLIGACTRARGCDAGGKLRHPRACAASA